MATFCSRCLQ